jgi:hypothetical protein
LTSFATQIVLFRIANGQLPLEQLATLGHFVGELELPHLHWIGDSAFNRSDFVTAFSGQGYEQGPRPGGLAAVPEPSSVVVVL